MDSARWNRIKELFMSAFDMSLEERAAFLDKCDADLRPEVERLLRADVEAGKFIDQPAMIGTGLVQNELTDLYVGKQIDAYKILRQIGHGGMGTVYLANRADGSFDKPVAIKLINRGMDTNSVLKRFVMERQILAQLQHPNIANLLDGGTTTVGLPYFVMEYVEGDPITKFCNSREFSIDERLDLFRKVCSAMSYAHQNLVVHRDIKPSNILVTDDSTPKLLDFGIAKLLHPDWSLDTSEATATMFRVMTPEYASPEQMRGLPITTASDVYSLGVVLYELLSGERPYKMESRLPEDVARVVLTTEPVKPSSVVSGQLSEVGKKTKEIPAETDLKFKAQNLKSLRGDLDNIILKAIRKEPERRYSSVQEFSEDIRRHLEGLPVTATADTSFYRLTKFAKRHRVGVFAGLAIAVTLFLATGITTWQAIVAGRERDRAERRFSQVRKLANTVLYEYQDGIRKLAGSTPVREKMLRDALEYLDNLSAEATDDADLQRELAAAYEKIGDVQSGDDSFGSLNQSANALLSYQKALKIREQISATFPYSSIDLFHLAVCYRQVGDSLGVTGDFPGRLVEYQKAIKIHEGLVQAEPSNEEFRNGFAGGLYDLGHADDQANDNGNAIANYDKAIEYWENLSNEDRSNAEVDRKLSKAYKFLGRVLEKQNRTEEAVGNYRKSILLDERRVTADNEDSQAKLDLSASNMVFANLYLKTRDLKSAEEFCRKGLEIRNELFNADPQNTDVIAFLARAYDTLGQIEQKNQNLRGAIEDYRQAIAIFTGPQIADKSDLISNNYLANFYKNLASAYEEVSTKAFPSGNRKQNLQNARENYQKAFDIVKTLQEHGTLTSQNSAGLDEIMKKINLCDAALRE